jgi:hypothetical protein
MLGISAGRAPAATRSWLAACLVSVLLLCGSACGSSSGSSSGGSGSSQSGHSGGSSATGPQSPVATNLHVPADVRAHLRVVLARVRESDLIHEQLGEAEQGTVFYAAFNGAHYAMATFDIRGRGAADQPSIFAKYGANEWVYGGNRLGTIATLEFLPCAVRNAWSANGCTAPVAAVISHRSFIRAASMACAGIGRQLGQGTTFVGIAKVSNAQLQKARALVGKLAAMEFDARDRTAANRLLTLEARLIGLASYAVEARLAQNQQGWTNSFIGFRRAAQQLGAVAVANGINHCGTA